MKKLAILLFLGFQISFAQNLYEHQIDYNTSFGFTDMAQLPGGDFMLTIAAYPHSDSSQAVLMKVDNSLNLKWAKRFKGLKRDDFGSITPLSDGNVLVGGTYRQQALPNVGGSLYKIDTAGNVLWAKFYSGSFDDRTIKIFEKSDGSLMVFIRQGVSNQPVKVLHITSSGTITSQRTFFDGSKGIGAEDVCESPNETYYIVGMATGTMSQTNLFVASVDDQGINWHKGYDFGRSITCYNIEYSTNGRLLVSGTIDHPTNSNADNYWTAALDTQGNLLWGQEYTATSLGSNWISYLSAIPNGGLAAFGRYAHSGISNSMMFATDSLGTIVYAAGHSTGSGSIVSIGMRVPNNGYLIAKQNNTSANVLYNANDTGGVACNNSSFQLTTSTLSATTTTGTPTSSTPNLTAMTPTYSVFPVAFSDSLTCELLVSLDEIDSEMAFQLYPTPTHDILNIEIRPELAAHVELVINDMQGRKLIDRNSHGETKLKLDVSCIPTGMYSIHLVSDTKVYSQKLLISRH